MSLTESYLAVIQRREPTGPREARPDDRLREPRRMEAASWFETAQERLLTMRSKFLIPRSGFLAASRGPHPEEARSAVSRTSSRGDAKRRLEGRGPPSFQRA